MDKEENIEIDNKSCRNCLSRFDCELKTEERFHSCDNYDFDDEAATCDDCSKKESCTEYGPNLVTCCDWKPIETCDDCEHYEKCSNYMEGGKICKKYKPYQLQLTEKGMLFIALMNCRLNTGLIENTDFFEVLDHEVKINGLLKSQRRTWIGRKYEQLKFLFRKKTDKTVHDIFKELAMKVPYNEYFFNSENTAEMVWNEFANILTDQYSKR